MEKNYVIKITGGGTFAGIMNTLRSVADEMDLILESGKPLPDDIQWEDPILMTEISEDEDEPEVLHANGHAGIPRVDREVEIEMLLKWLKILSRH